MSAEDRPVTASVITPPGEGGIGIIALNGPGAAALLDRFFVGTKRSARQLAPGSLAHGRIRDGDRTIDEVIVAHLDGELSPTGEPYYEVNCHGGVQAVRSVLECFRRAGAHVVGWQEGGPQQPGAAPEPVLAASGIRQKTLNALPRALTRLAVAMLLHQAQGALWGELCRIRAALSEPDPEEAGRLLAGLLATAAFGSALLKPQKVAITGPPNVGKSTLLNALLKKERVLVHRTPGTTRDVVSEVVSIGGVPVELMDSAGIREPCGDVESQAVTRARDLVRTCDVLLMVYDVRRGVQAALADMPLLRPGRRILLVGNKIDLLRGPPSARPLPTELADCPHLLISAKEGTNIAQLECALLAPFQHFINHAREGGAVAFDGEIQTAVQAIADALKRSGPAEALKLLNGAPHRRERRGY